MDETQQKLYQALARVSPRLRDGDEVVKAGERMAAEEARMRCEASERATRVLAKYGTLRQITLRHEAVIQKRWAKRTKQQRLRILIDIRPGIPAGHQPDYHLMRRGTTAINHRGQAIAKDKGWREPFKDLILDFSSTHRMAFLCPQINQEDLSNPRALPLLLNSRGRNHPSAFAAADNRAMQLGINFGVLTRTVLLDFVMILSGVTDSANYGRILALDGNPRAVSWRRENTQFAPDEGLLVLEAQEQILDFLIQCSRRLLQDIPQARLTSDMYPIQPKLGLSPADILTGFQSLLVMREEAPYRVPGKFDLGRIESLLAARLLAAEDYVWSLREDPGYFMEQIFEEQEHSVELLKDVHGGTHPICKRGSEDKLWARSIRRLLTKAYIQLERFSELHQQAQRLQRLQVKYDSVISPFSGLPEAYWDALLIFRFFLLGETARTAYELEKVAAASPPLRIHFVRDPAQDAEVLFKTFDGLKDTLKRGRAAETLLTAFLTLWDPQILSRFRLTLVIDELERFVGAEKQARDLISSSVAGLIGDLSILSQCLGQLDLYQPWARSFAGDSALSRVLTMEEEYHRRTGARSQIDTWLRSQEDTIISIFGDPSQSRFAYPIDKRRNRETVEALQRAEKNFDAFWSEIDKAMHANVKELQSTTIVALLSQPRALYRTSDWIAPVESRASSGPSPDGYTRPFSTPYSATVDDFARKPELAPLPKAKLKTRGTASAHPESASVEVPIMPDESSANLRPRFAVDARSQKTFKTLFFDPGATSSPGTVLWKDFLHAMTSVDFEARKLYGSVWQFRPTKLHVDRPIQFHEPHSENKIPFLTARRFGRRLNRAYGWAADTFSLREKGGQT